MLYVADASLRNLLLVFGMSLFVLPFLLQWVFQGHDRMHLVSITQVVRQIVFTSVVLIFVGGISDLIIVGFAEIAAVCSASLLSVILFLKVFPDQSRLTPRLSAETIRSGGTIGLSQLFWVVKMFGATVIVGMIATAGETGLFAAAMRIFVALHTFVWLYFFNLLPSLSRGWENDRRDFLKLLRESRRLVLLVAIPASIVGIILAPYLMTIAYGGEFLNGAGALRWLAVACLLAAVSGHFRFGLIAAGHQSREMISSAAGAAAAILMLPVGYYIGGVTYAALGLCIAEAVILSVAWLQARKIFESHDGEEDHRVATEPLTGLAQSAR
jgi:O-antigen/teichoic acid export membrane protein